MPDTSYASTAPGTAEAPSRSEAAPAGAPAIGQGPPALSFGGAPEAAGAVLSHWADEASVQLRPSTDAGGVSASVRQAQSLLRAHTEDLSASVGGVLPASATLGKTDDLAILTGAASSFVVGGGRRGVSIQFSPPIHIRPQSLVARVLGNLQGHILLSRASYSFESGRVWIESQLGALGRFASYFVDIERIVEDRLTDLLHGKLPPHMRKPDYDPYADASLPGVLQGLADDLSSLPSAGGGGDLMSRITQPMLHGTIEPREMKAELPGGIELLIGPGSALDVTAYLSGSAAQATERPRIDRIHLSSHGIKLRMKSGGELTAITLRSAGFGKGMKLDHLDYDLGIEDGATALKLAVLFASVYTGRDMGVHDTQEVRLQAVRQILEKEVNERLPPLLREQVLTHDGVIPGYSLKTLLQMD